MTSIGLGKRNFRSGGYGVATNNGDGEDHHHLILQSGGARYLEEIILGMTLECEDIASRMNLGRGGWSLYFR